MNTWTTLRSLLEAKCSVHAGIINPPAAAAEIAALEAQFGVKLPKAARELYENCNGQASPSPGVLLGMTVLPIQAVIDEAVTWSDIDNADFEPENFSSTPEGAIKLEYTNRLWLPLFNIGGDGNHVGLDFDPGPNGTKAQVINFGRDEDDKCVLAESLEQFLKDCVASIQEDDGLEFRPDGRVSYRGVSYIGARISKLLGHELAEPDPDSNIVSIWISRSGEYPDGYFEVGKGNGLDEDFNLGSGNFDSSSFANSDRSPLNLDLLCRIDSTLGACQVALRKRLAVLGVSEVRQLLIVKGYDHATKQPSAITSDHALFLGSFSSG